jgi:hypothetical protein
MDTIAFVDEGDVEVGVRIWINGRELVDVVREVELPFATREGHPDLAGSYLYFGSMFVFFPSRYFLGEPVNDWSDGPGRIYVLSCTCGFPQCWALSTRVDVGETGVRWSDFRQIHRGPAAKAGEWKYEKLGPFVFDRKLYEQELAKAPAVRKPRLAQENKGSKLTQVFNLGFRRGANDRANAGIAPASERPSDFEGPAAPAECVDDAQRKAWEKGYRIGFQCGASDGELAGVEMPGAHGLITGFDSKFLEQFGFLKEPPTDEHEKAK